MTDAPSDADLARWAALADAATPGPWRVECDGGVDGSGEGWSTLEVDFADPLEPHAGLMLGDHENSPADAEFIAAARTMCPRLIAEVQRLRQLVEDLGGQP